MREIKFTIHYKLRHGWFWRRLRNVVGDTIVTHVVRKDAPPIPLAQHRWSFEFEDGSKIELPLDTAVRFSRERWHLIKQQMERDAGQTIMTKRG